MFLFDAWNRCNNNCVMCSNPSKMYQNKKNSAFFAKEFIIEKIKKKREELIKTKDSIQLTGGEPTIHPEFLDIIRKIRFFLKYNEIFIITNGRRLFYESFVRDLLEVENLTLQISLHGYSATTHDSVTRVKGSFNQAIRGIANLIKYKNSSQKIEIRIILTKKNYEIIDKIYEKIFRLFPSVESVVLIFHEIEGNCKKNADKIAVSHAECKKIVQRVTGKWSDKFKEFRLYHFPLCTLNFNCWKYIHRTLPGYELTFLESCNDCLYKKYCLGIHFGYLDFFGKKEFKPIKKNIKLKLSNNFHHPIVGVFK